MSDLQSHLGARWQTLFSGDELFVACRDKKVGKNLAVTFDHVGARLYRDGTVPGEHFLEQEGYDHIHFGCNFDRWYQSPEIGSALAAIMSVRDDYENVLLYGLSMGGYAALLFSGALKATKVIAFAPQYSIDPARAPFETRWASHALDVRFVFDDMATAAANASVKYVVFDPYYKPDRAHIDLMRDIEGIQLVPLPFSGHYPARFLIEAGVLSTVLTTLIRSSDPLPFIRSARRPNRRKSRRYLFELSAALAARGSTRRALRVANLAYVMDNASSHVLEAYLQVLQHDRDLKGVRHIVLRLLKAEQPEWTHYDGSRAEAWNSLVADNQKYI